MSLPHWGALLSPDRKAESKIENLCQVSKLTLQVEVM